MKKNKMMRIASILMVVTLLSTCAISGTFAKYVTKVSGEDSARVAKWGIILGLNAGDAFATEYQTHDDEYEGEFSVVSSNEDKVVAPGTSSEDVNKDNLTATVFGTPEVAARYVLEIKGLKDVILPAGEYTDYTELVPNDDGEYGYFNTFVLEDDYTPVKWDITVSNTNGVSYTLTEVAAALGRDFDGFSFTDAQSIVETESIMNQLLPMLEGMVEGASNAKCEVETDDEGNKTIVISMDFDPNTEMDYTFELSWKWAFEQEEVDLYDKADTFLGNWAAVELGDEIEGFEAPEDGSIELAASLTAKAVQID
jgi:hypothetical protein